LAQQLAITHTRFPAIPPLLKKPQERPEARETPHPFPCFRSQTRQEAAKRAAIEGRERGRRAERTPCPERWRGRWNFRRAGRWSRGRHRRECSLLHRCAGRGFGRAVGNQFWVQANLSRPARWGKILLPVPGLQLNCFVAAVYRSGVCGRGDRPCVAEWILVLEVLKHDF
jgi:hypothetical protein